MVRFTDGLVTSICGSIHSRLLIYNGCFAAYGSLFDCQCISVYMTRLLADRLHTDNDYRLQMLTTSFQVLSGSRKGGNFLQAAFEFWPEEAGVVACHEVAKAHEGGEACSTSDPRALLTLGSEVPLQ